MMKFIRFAGIALVIGLILYWLGSSLFSFFQNLGLEQPEETRGAVAESGDDDASPEAPDAADTESPEGLVAGASVESGLVPTIHTSAAYRPPQYDPFNNKYRPYEEFQEEIFPEDRGHNTAPTPAFRVRTQERGLADEGSGTVATTFIFDANGSTDSETRHERLQVRWDFDSDGTPETWFSRRKRASHSYEKAGIYTVTLEVLDGGGLVSRTRQQVTVVNNTDPSGRFTYTPSTGTTNQIFTFHSNGSQDSQYQSSYLEYRFDWEGDGVWDTPYQRKTSWKHRFETVGTHTVLMETRDPEGATDISRAFITITKNTPPVAAFTVNRKDDRYTFDAGNSFDAEAPDRLLYRWDFDYTGPNDIHFDTRWSSASRVSRSYGFSDTKIVRLQVRDQDGAVVEIFRSLQAL